MWIKRQSEQRKNNYLPVFLKNFSLDKNKKVVSCLLKITATGIFDIVFNGEEFGDYFMPGWANYNKYINECEYDLTERLKKENEIFVTVANGWYSGKLGYGAGPNYYGDKKRLKAEIIIEYSDKTMQKIETDENWATFSSNILEADFFNGETIDYTQSVLSQKLSAVVCDFDIKCEKYTYEPVRVIEKIEPKIIHQEKNKIRMDFGKNFAGVVSFNVKGKRGEQLTVKFAEVLDKDGTLYTENLRRAKCTDTLILSGEEDFFNPKFTYHGFRYAEISANSEFVANSIIGNVLSEDIDYYGNFECSNSVINNIYKIAKNGQESNFVSIPTDCPQRDERLGWTGDAEVFCNTAMFNADCKAFFSNYLKLICADTLTDGRIPSFAPLCAAIADNTAGVPGWGDCIAVIPYFHYLHYRDKSVIEKCLSFADKWVGYYLSKSDNYLTKIINNFGDWLSIDRETDVDVINQCYFGYSALLTSKMHKIVGDDDGYNHYYEIYENCKKAFRDNYFDGEKIKSDTETAYAFALAVGFITKEETKKRLPLAIKEKNNSLTTGFIGSRFILPMLCEIGETALAYELIEKTDFPSLGYMIENGATTVWERWNGYTKENGFEDPEMNSFNHYSLGSCVEWLYTYVLGIKLSPDTEKIVISPSFYNGLTFAKGQTKVNGKEIFISWEYKKDTICLKVVADDSVKYEIKVDKEIISRESKDGATTIIFRN